MILLGENVTFGLPLQVEELFRNCCTVQQTQIEIYSTKVKLHESEASQFSGCVVSFPVQQWIYAIRREEGK